MFLVIRLARRVISTIVGAIILALVASSGWVLVTALRDNTTTSDALVVLGAAQFDGTPSPVLANRLDHAYALWKDDVARQVITVGGNQPGDRYTEATAGRNYLHAKGIPWTSLKAIKTGRDTLQSMAAVAKWARAQGIKSITVVTDRCHEARAAAMLRSFDFTVRTSAAADGPGSSITWEYIARETGGLLRFWLVDQRSGTATLAGN